MDIYIYMYIYIFFFWRQWLAGSEEENENLYRGRRIKAYKMEEQRWAGQSRRYSHPVPTDRMVLESWLWKDSWGDLCPAGKTPAFSGVSAASPGQDPRWGWWGCSDIPTLAQISSKAYQATPCMKEDAIRGTFWNTTMCPIPFQGLTAVSNWE